MNQPKTKEKQVTRDNHYVPKWYQRGFMPKGRHKLYVRNLQPGVKSLPNGSTLAEPEVEELGPKLAFVELDLYTTRFGSILNDDIETFLFGPIDKTGADAVRGWISGDQTQIHRRFQDFFDYLDAQKLRTPKGLDWILKHYDGLPQLDLMLQMQSLRQMHCAMWTECVREIVSASKATVKFLVSDHPVTVFNPKMSPDSTGCKYPGEPGVQMVGTQTIFALDANHCLILTNLEYAESPSEANLLARRTNARFRGDAMARTDALIRGRHLTDDEVHAINLVLRSRAKQYVAAGRPEWLYPERYCNLSWAEISPIFLPRDGLFKFGGEVFIGYADGSTAYRDQFGRTSKAHELTAKPRPITNPQPEDQCGCGGGLKFSECCADIEAHIRPSWRVMSIRERNLALIRAIKNILQLDGSDASWLRMRRTLSDEQVSRIYKVQAALWPRDTQLIDLLPSPQRRRSRALFMGSIDPRFLSESITGMLAYVDELVVVHPFINADTVRKEFSPIHQPANHREQTVRNAFTLLVLERAIEAGRLHLVPDPLDFDLGYREEIKAIADRKENIEIGPIDDAMVRFLEQDEKRRFLKRLPAEQMKSYIKERIPRGSDELSDADIDSVIALWKQEAELDPLALLMPISDDFEGEFRIIKSFARETGLFVATLTGAFVYTNSDTQWKRLHASDGVHAYEPDSNAATVIRQIDALHFKLPSLTYHHVSKPAGADAAGHLLRTAFRTLRQGEELAVDSEHVTAEAAPGPEDEGLMIYNVRASAPAGGFRRTDVSRLVLTFGRTEDVAPVRLAPFIEPTVNAA
ncbi:hypothetical protein AVME950_08265 [Acidovorax sp. SUPP950]|uniref:DUF4238 domain-containing protein n=1 Tax=Acidovorax sp. SUPP950 TaxID=511901 RepID=UPI0023C3C39B|nr:DUF4238 domain-containing protein [Acidovorax sp. SUPP950]GKS74871.1 hypothetical protein AVME950_08265 [Acidovorax sp. SUPP950]